MRSCEGLVDSLLYVIHTCVNTSDYDSKVCRSFNNFFSLLSGELSGLGCNLFIPLQSQSCYAFVPLNVEACKLKLPF